MKFTHFKSSIDSYELPERFTFPFYYEPHPLCLLATEQLQEHIQTQTEWTHNFGLEGSEGAIGKMFGVLIVQKSDNEIGFLSAFSGKLADSNHHAGFVPPVFDMLTEGSFFNEGMKAANIMTQAIAVLENEEEYVRLKTQLKTETSLSAEEVKNKKVINKNNKLNRREKRAINKDVLSEEEYNLLLDKLGHESRQDHFELRDLKAEWKLKLNEIQINFDQLNNKIIDLKEVRRSKSNDVQQRLFSNYNFLNKDGITKNLKEIFSHTSFATPPSAAGECAAPKLLHYAFKNGLRPVAMAEFWWGVSPAPEIKKHKQFYSACRGKCEPILHHMLEGMSLEDNPMMMYDGETKKITTVYEDDELLIINKPTEFLSVPGKVIKDSVWMRMKHKYPEATGPLIVHRLDMSTTGLMIIAKTKEAHKEIQSQFINRKIKKRYIALLDGVVEEDEGYINLPLRQDYEDRPRQLVCHEHGKRARTSWNVLERKENTTKIHFHPITGRTHQLRVHAAHHLGLNMPIIGDDLYGKKGDRLHLHAEWIEFDHPKTKERVSFHADADF
jgi:tRNA pseudouridine32 synthase/23S rRNA pseudouridine746 synthase